MLTRTGSMKSNDPDSDATWLKSLGYFSIIIGDIAACTGIGVGLGYLAMSRWGAPWWVLMFSSMAGLVLAFYRLYRMTMRDAAEQKSEKEK
jgi:F0F1-type ATP synthase assembly protein I